MKQKIINFIKYNNITAIAISLVLVSTMGVMASEDLRNTVIGEEVITESGIDNTKILQANLDNFDLEVTITGALEDLENFYIDYQFKTLGIEDNSWQLLFRKKTLIVSKSSLKGRDLGLYVQEELSEVADYELNYLKEVQEGEEEKGETEVVEIKEYTGLIGLVLDMKNKILSGYEPIVEQSQIEHEDSQDSPVMVPEPEPVVEEPVVEAPVSEESPAEAPVEEPVVEEPVVEDPVAEKPPAEEPPVEPEPEPEPPVEETPPVEQSPTE